MQVLRTYSFAIISVFILFSYVCGVMAFYPTTFGLPTFTSSLSLILCLPQAIASYVMLPIAIIQFLMAYRQNGEPRVSFVHHIVSGIAIISCQFMYWLLITIGFMMTN